MVVRIIGGKETLEEAKAAMKDARLALQNDHVVMKQIATYLDRWVQKNFQSQGGKVGGWKPFKYGGRLTTKKKASAQSLDGRRYVNPSAKLLQDTGHLRISMLPFSRKGNAGIGSDLPYSKAHEEGTQTLPQRRMLPTHEDVAVDVQEIINNWTVVTIKKAAQQFTGGGSS